MLAGRAHEALPLADRLPELGRRAGGSPGDLLMLRSQRAQALVNAGRFEEAERLLRRVGKDRAHWHICEVLHNIAFLAELKLERFADALRHSEAIITSMAERGASEVELARELLNSAVARRDAGNLALSRVVIHRAADVRGRRGRGGAGRGPGPGATGSPGPSTSPSPTTAPTTSPHRPSC